MEMSVIVVPTRKCPNCGRESLLVRGTRCDYVCPQCGYGFCSRCYKSDYEGPGDYVFCPACKARLFFPQPPPFVD